MYGIILIKCVFRSNRTGYNMQCMVHRKRVIFTEQYNNIILYTYVKYYNARTVSRRRKIVKPPAVKYTHENNSYNNVIIILHAHSHIHIYICRWSRMRISL